MFWRELSLVVLFPKTQCTSNNAMSWPGFEPVPLDPKTSPQLWGHRLFTCGLEVAGKWSCFLILTYPSYISHRCLYFSLRLPSGEITYWSSSSVSMDQFCRLPYCSSIVLATSIADAFHVYKCTVRYRCYSVIRKVSVKQGDNNKLKKTTSA